MKQDQQKDQIQTKEWKPISILQAINACVCLMIFPYMLTYTLNRMGIDLWLAALSMLIGLWAFLALYRQTKHVELFNFEK